MAGPKIRIKLRAYDHRMLDVASTMSINRLCVSIWKCSRESLYLCGERITV